jgi:hypothetical protein
MSAAGGDRARMKAQLLAVLQRLTPDVAAKLWRVDDVRDLPRDTREAVP